MDHRDEKRSRKHTVVTVALTVAAMLVLYQLFLKRPELEQTTKAVVVLKGSSSISGTVTFEQSAGTGPVTVSGEIRNVDPASLRGFHIHEFGDLTNGCTSTGLHYNPFDKVHGARTDATRHVGDLGNIVSDEYGIATFSFVDDVISLNGPTSIVGRAVVLHEGEDDLGRGSNEDSLKTGNAGGRAACGVIGLA